MIISVLVKFAREEDERDRDSKCKLTNVFLYISMRTFFLSFKKERLPDMTFLSSKETTSLIDHKEP